MRNVKAVKSSVFFRYSPILEGIATLLNIGGNFHYFQFSANPRKTDLSSLSEDWKNIGNDFYASMKKVDKEIASAKAKQLKLDF